MDEQEKVITIEQRFEELSLLFRNLIGAMKQLEKAKHYDKRLYWTQAVNHWVENARLVVNGGHRFEPPISVQLITELDENLRNLYKSSLDRTIIDDLLYRVRALYDSMVSLENVKISAIVANHSNLKENIEQRIKELEERKTLLNDSDTPPVEKAVELARLSGAILELRALTYVPENIKTNVK